MEDVVWEVEMQIVAQVRAAFVEPAAKKWLMATAVRQTAIAEADGVMEFLRSDAVASANRKLLMDSNAKERGMVTVAQLDNAHADIVVQRWGTAMHVQEMTIVKVDGVMEL